ncbi:MAG: aldehyde dehydrogenase [Spirochaetia bacterium]|nr:aldehyde dehydrogenase [Spirochaetia bacterium]NCC89401.1 aldehyde dehydrogenase [Spirochaetia bacterium]
MTKPCLGCNTWSKGRKSMNEVQLCLAEMRTFFASGTTLSVAWRKEQLLNLKKHIREYEKPIMNALFEDLGKSDFEAFASEIGIVYQEIDNHARHLERWAAKKRVKGSLLSFPSKAYTIAQPKGVVLVMSPWNYPFQLSIAPLVSALAAGNCIILKPSRYSFHTAQVLEDLLSKTFPSHHVATFQGGSEMNKELLSHRFDHIFFTGSPEVGRIVMQEAAKRLTPVTLELGGKSPVIVEADSDIDLAARRIIWGKCLNAGQTCVAPDYVLVDQKVEEQLLEALKRAVTAMFGTEALHHNDYPHIINQKHFSRLISLFDMGNLAYGGQIDPKSLRIAPTIITDPKLDSPLMTEEIFGPILPLVRYDSFEQALAFVQSREHPLALYLFSNNKEHQQQVVQTLQYGGGCINDVVMHLSNSHLPFGGVGQSGIGSYHAKDGFLTFSHTKSILQSSALLEIKLRYAPFRGKLALIRRLFPS